jgi:hypothetical protein
MMDDELDELLDSALGDFVTKKPPSSVDVVTIERTDLIVDPLSSSSNVNATKTSDHQTGSSSSKPLMNEADFKIFDEIFNDEKTKESLKQFTNAFSMFGGESKTNAATTQNMTNPDPTKLFEEFEMMMNELAKTNFDDDDDDDDEDDDDEKFIEKLNARMNQAAKVDPMASVDLSASSTATTPSTQNPLDKILENMNKQSESILKDDDIFGSLNGNSSPHDDESNLLMQPLLKMLFSKDILYPSLKMMLDNYDKYLNENKVDKETTVEYKNCLKQKDHIIEMCKIYEASNETDSQEIKSKQLQSILELLEKCGHPPKELVPDMNPIDGVFKNSCPIS